MTTMRIGRVGMNEFKSCLLRRAATSEKTLLVRIDGVCGSGKSSFANNEMKPMLEKRGLPVCSVNMDWALEASFKRDLYNALAETIQEPFTHQIDTCIDSKWVDEKVRDIVDVLSRASGPSSMMLNGIYETHGRFADGRPIGMRTGRKVINIEPGSVVLVEGVNSFNIFPEYENSMNILMAPFRFKVNVDRRLSKFPDAPKEYLEASLVYFLLPSFMKMLVNFKGRIDYFVDSKNGEEPAIYS